MNVGMAIKSVSKKKSGLSRYNSRVSKMALLLPENKEKDT
jgi:hypothetical protein